MKIMANLNTVVCVGVYGIIQAAARPLINNSNCKDSGTEIRHFSQQTAITLVGLSMLNMDFHNYNSSYFVIFRCYIVSYVWRQ